MKHIICMNISWRLPYHQVVIFSLCIILRFSYFERGIIYKQQNTLQSNSLFSVTKVQMFLHCNLIITLYCPVCWEREGMEICKLCLTEKEEDQEQYIRNTKETAYSNIRNRPKILKTRRSASFHTHFPMRLLILIQISTLS